MLTTGDFDYNLDPRRIAQVPLQRRDQSKLMVLDRCDGRRSHRIFADLPQLLHSGDLLVLNKTRVVPAKFHCRRQTGGRIEGLFLRESSPGQWNVMFKGAGRCKVGEKLQIEGAASITLELLENLGAGRWQVACSDASPAEQTLQKIGQTPLPPYIHRPGAISDGEDRLKYQTVYASSPGAVAAPTAGLHFTDALLAELKRAEIELAYVTLHVGMGTFLPVKAENLAAHEMHEEWYELSAETAGQLNAARESGRRIVAVGTTSLRVLETLARRGDRFEQHSGWTDLFIYPPAEFKAVGALITNFHLPRSTLLMLAAAFCSPGDTRGVKMILDAYAEAQKMEYRFYSYGDAMLIE